ncbi:MAG TPA: 50S ribosomal protein L28 [Candidatus Moranbacteria bacterium]|nr:50S ribosomal protein L28 [Candidatus Moranbacteria bacterium]HRZ33395.1 50S ribosomal protein L28 [Candidatus Moranbacteria bacterium]
MSRACNICGRGTTFGNSRSHSNIATRRKFAINIQTKKIDGKKVKICTKCIKTKSKSK